MLLRSINKVKHLLGMTSNICIIKILFFFLPPLEDRTPLAFLLLFPRMKFVISHFVVCQEGSRAYMCFYQPYESSLTITNFVKSST